MAGGNEKWGFTPGPKRAEEKLSELAGDCGFKVENFFRINEVSSSSSQPGLSPEEFIKMFLERPSELRNVLAGGNSQQKSSEPSDVSEPSEETDAVPKARRRRMKKREEKGKKLSEKEKKEGKGEKSSTVTDTLDAQLKDMKLKSDDDNNKGQGDGKSKGEKSVDK